MIEDVGRYLIARMGLYKVIEAACRTLITLPTNFPADATTGIQSPTRTDTPAHIVNPDTRRVVSEADIKV